MDRRGTHPKAGLFLSLTPRPNPLNLSISFLHLKFFWVKTHFWDQVDFRPILELALDQNCATTVPNLQLQNALMMVSTLT